MLSTLGPVAFFLIVAVIFPVVPLFLSRFLAPRRPPNPVKLEPYESGMETIGPTHVQFPIRYYLYAFLYVLFAVESVFLFPWAVALGRIGALGLASMGIFLGILVVGFIYEWKKGALEWD